MDDGDRNVNMYGVNKIRYGSLLKFCIILLASFDVLCLADNVPSGDGKSAIDNNLNGRIVNGTKAILGQIPHQVSLRKSYSNRHFCGGVVIADRWILTAGHCMFNKNGAKISPWVISVIAGQVEIHSSININQKRAVDAIILHPRFELSSLDNDIALLRLSMPLDLNGYKVKPVKLETKMPKPGSLCLVSGWGYLHENITVVSNDLMCLVVPLIGMTHCRKLLENSSYLRPGSFCAGYEEGLRDACNGDSGGPITCDDVLTGIVSSGDGCARPSSPGIYTDVAYYRNWIEFNIKNFDRDTTGKLIIENNRPFNNIWPNNTWHPPNNTWPNNTWPNNTWPNNTWPPINPGHPWPPINPGHPWQPRPPGKPGGSSQNTYSSFMIFSVVIVFIIFNYFDVVAL